MPEVNVTGMAELLNEVKWSDPILPKHRDPEWEAEVKAKFGNVPDILMHVAPSPWLRKAVFHWPNVQPVYISRNLTNIEALVVAQENACRFCYGIARSYMRLNGFSDKEITRLERQMHLAELDEKDRTFIRFCRDLARSNPRPARKDLDALVDLGFSEEAVIETAFHVANSCFANRVATFIAAPPLTAIEKLSTGLLNRIMRPLIRKQLMQKVGWKVEGLSDENGTSFSGVVQAMKGVPHAQVIHEGLKAVFSSDVLSKELRIFMFAVVAKSLDCQFCQTEACKMANDLGIDSEEFSDTINRLTSHRLPPDEARLLAWTRETVHYQTEQIQRQMHLLANDIDSRKLLEAVGVAAVANMTVRLAVLLG